MHDLLQQENVYSQRLALHMSVSGFGKFGETSSRSGC